jgi:transcription initiation factor TFIIIB Brf1 subunit/transcription initiation factor TFIIB
MCGGVKTFNEDMLPVCTSCGICESQFVSDEPEWRSGIDDDGHVSDPSRVGMPVDLELFSESWGMGTIMKIKTFASSTEKKIARIDFHNSMNHKDRALFHSYEDLDKVGATLGLNHTIMRQAKILYKKFSEEKLTRGAVRLGIKANCILWSCKMENVPRTAKEVADVFNIPVKDVSRTVELFKEAIDVRPVNNITYPANVLVRFFNELTVIPDEDKRRVKMHIVRICEKIQRSTFLMGKTPKGTASAVMYVMLNNLGYTIDKQSICRICEVSIPTLNKIEPIVREEIKKLAIV